MAEPRIPGPEGQTKPPGSRARSKPRSTPAPQEREQSAAARTAPAQQSESSDSERKETSPTGTFETSIEVIGMTAIDRDLMIAEAAYYRAERRNFAAGHELDDWLDAEKEIDRLLLEQPREQRARSP